MLRLPPLISLRAFEAAARHLSFKAAADELRVTPTAVSHQIRLLEQFCRQPLFRRHPRPLALTKAGEQLFPVLRDGFTGFAQALEALGSAPASPGLRVTTTSAFAARWLMPRLPRWRKAHPDIPLDIISTYDVLDLKAGDADVAIRYARAEPTDGVAFQLLRDRFHVVGSPVLVGDSPEPLQPEELVKYALIETGWPSDDDEAPTWKRLEREARARGGTERLTQAISLRFEEEVHAIEAVIAGHGLAICSDVLVADELASGRLVKLSAIVLDGYGFYLVHRPKHPKQAQITAFLEWAKGAV